VCVCVCVCVCVSVSVSVSGKIAISAGSSVCLSVCLSVSVCVSDMRECQEWIDTINFVAASYSAPCQFDATEQKRFQRPLLPACCTTLNLVK